ncbi:hypothetical protein [Pontibacter sp. G13]|uniref:hypothetical protein n=1 Tax=Pontibacter sp. G13 TaxID=3074898 RepID=UPI0028891DF9|nr:hypothetical protein [Pontibacter sp. G13]WNJ20357.1 hypothetical protein RJD25_07740 [Pontibacter sp. G13]
MDSKQLHRKFYSRYDLANWFDDKGELVKADDAHYVHCGTQEDFNKDLLDKHIQDFYMEDKVYLIIGSGNSSLCSKSNLLGGIERFIGKKQIGLMDQELKKLIFISHIGVFKKGVVIDHPKNRKRQAGSILNVAFHANKMDRSTQRVADMIREPLDFLSKKLSNDYNGNMEHLWIDIELIERDKPWSFRFQKRVTLSGFGLPGKEFKYNVGHYSVKPDFEKLQSTTDDSMIAYILLLLFNSTEILFSRKKTLGDFDTDRFRSDFTNACKELGFEIA